MPSEQGTLRTGVGGGRRGQLSPPRAPRPPVGRPDSVCSYFRETQPSGTALPASCLIWSHPQLPSNPRRRRAPPEQPRSEEPSWER